MEKSPAESSRVSSSNLEDELKKNNRETNEQRTYGEIRLELRKLTLIRKNMKPRRWITKSDQSEFIALKSSGRIY